MVVAARYTGTPEACLLDRQWWSYHLCRECKPPGHMTSNGTQRLRMQGYRPYMVIQRPVQGPLWTEPLWLMRWCCWIALAAGWMKSDLR